MSTRRKRLVGAVSVVGWLLLILTLPQDLVTAGDNVWDALHDPVFSRAVLGLLGLAVIALIWFGPSRLLHGGGDGREGTDLRDSAPAAPPTPSPPPRAPIPATREPPQLVFRDPVTVEATVIRPPKLATPGKFLVVPVSNDPAPGVNAVAAEHVRAYVTIFDPGGRVLIPERLARWQDKPQATQLSPYQPTGAPEISEMTLHPNGADHGIDTVVYVREDREFYVWTQQGLAGRVKSDVFLVRVRVRGSNASGSTTLMVSSTPENPYDGFVVTPGALPGSSAAVSDAVQARQTTNPYAVARKLESEHKSRRLRTAMRTVAEDELANLVRPRLQKLIDGDAMSMRLATAQWSAHHEVIREDADQQAYAAATKAYRMVVDLHESLSLEDRQEHLTNAELDHARETLAAVEAALALLRVHAP